MSLTTPDPPSPSSVSASIARGHPLRFIWQLDEEGRFTLVSGEFIGLAGMRTAAAIGKTWQDMAAELDLDSNGQVARAIATQDTWSGLVVPWPVDGDEDRLPVELSGLPVFDRERVFRGYRGFGVCRDISRLAALAASRETTTPPVQAQVERAAQDCERAPDNDISTVVPCRSTTSEPVATALSPVEHLAFREISRKLTQGLAAAETEHNPENAEPWPPEDAVAVAQALPEITAEARPILDKIPSGILVYRLNQLLYANPTFLQWCGHRTLDDLIAAGGLDEIFIEPIGAAAAGNPSSRLTIACANNLALDGELINVAWEGESAHAVITKLRASELDKARLTEVAELKSMLQAASDGFILIDRQGLILAASSSAQELFDYGPHSLTGTAFTQLFSPESVDTANDCLAEVLRQGTCPERGREVSGQLRQGGSIALFMTIAPIGDDGGKVCAVFRDLTRWKKTEAALIEAKRHAEDASSAKSDFLARMSHEIRTPLNSIIGFSEVMMAERFGPIGSDRYRAYLKDIRASGDHLLSLIGDLLDLAKIEAGKQQLTFTDLALNDLILQTVAIMQPQAARARILIRTSLAPALPQVIGDARSMRQIVLNLLSNSLKFTAAGGQVIVSTALEENGEVVLRVRDTGVGMTEQEIATALEPFRQLTTSPRAGTAGTGLGLPLTKAMAEANRAKFRLASAPKEGTLVEITFPAGAARQREPGGFGMRDSQGRASGAQRMPRDAGIG